MFSRLLYYQDCCSQKDISFSKNKRKQLGERASSFFINLLLWWCSCCLGAFSTGLLFSSLHYFSLWKPALEVYPKQKIYTTKWSVTLSELWEEWILVKTHPQELRHFWQVPTMIQEWNHNELFAKISFWVLPLKLKRSHCFSNASSWINMWHCMGNKDNFHVHFKVVESSKGPSN